MGRKKLPESQKVRSKTFAIQPKHESMVQELAKDKSMKTVSMVVQNAIELYYDTMKGKI